MMFETPTPPTSSEIAAIAASTRVSSPRMRPMVPRIWVWVTAENSSPSYLSCSAATSCFWSTSTDSDVGALTASPSMRSTPNSR
jgi:hypothetical protein